MIEHRRAAPTHVEETDANRSCGGSSMRRHGAPQPFATLLIGAAQSPDPPRLSTRFPDFRLSKFPESISSRRLPVSSMCHCGVTPVSPVASTGNRVSSMRALVNSLVQQINEKFPGSTTTANRLLARGREPSSMPTLVFNWRPLPVASVWSSWQPLPTAPTEAN